MGVSPAWGWQSSGNKSSPPPAGGRLGASVGWCAPHTPLVRRSPEARWDGGMFPGRTPLPESEAVWCRPSALGGFGPRLRLCVCKTRVCRMSKRSRCACKGHRGQIPEAASRLPGERSSHRFAVSCAWCPLAGRSSLPAARGKQAAGPRRPRARDLVSQDTADAAQITVSHRRRGSGGPLRVTAPLESPRLSLVRAQRCLP